jgi:hypothetical protein
MQRSCFIAALLSCTLARGAYAQADVVEREIKATPGRDVRVAVYTSIRPDCTSGPLPTIRLANGPTHGTVTVKRGTFRATNFNKCLATDVPAFVAFYRAVRDFAGGDEFELEVTFSGGRKQIEHFKLSVSNAQGQGI